MKHTRLVLLLPAVQVLLAIVLLVAGSRQKPSVLQDFPPFVAPATKVCQAINAPVLPLEGGLIALSQRAGIDLGSHQTRVWELCFLAGVVFLWFLAGLEIESQLHQRRTRWRALVDCVAICIGVALLFFALAAWRQAESILTVGSAAWSIVLIAIYGRELALSFASRRSA